MTSPDRDRVLVSRGDLEALFAGFERGAWVGGATHPHKGESAADVRDRAFAARSNLFRALHGDVQQEVVDEVAAQEAPPSASPVSGVSGGAEGLLPCPFCGGAAVIVREGTLRQSCIVECEDCGCRLESNETFESGYRWNRRAPVALAAPSALEAFEGAADVLAGEAVDVALGREGGRLSPTEAGRIARAIESATGWCSCGPVCYGACQESSS